MSDTDVCSNASDFVRRLNTTERLVMMLRYAEELTVHEITLVLDLPEAVVTSTLDALKQRASSALAVT